MMWRTKFKGVSGNPQQLTSNAISYAKYTDSGFNMDGRDEDKEYWVNSDGNRTVLESGRWYSIRQRVKMNEPGVSNGILQIWLDGKLVHDQNDVLFRTTGDFSIDQMYFSTFFGGNEDWRTSKDETVYFDDFEIKVPEPPREPRFLKVPGNYDSIQEAIDASLPGDTVAVRGQHTGNIVVDKAIFIRGYRGTRLTALDRNEPAIRISADGVRLKRFEVRHGTEGVRIDSDLNDVVVEFITAIESSNHGIHLQSGCDGATLSKNRVLSSDNDGIFVESCDDVRLVDCKAFYSGGAGFHVVGSNNAVVAGNFARQNSTGFSIHGNHHTIDDNISFSNVGVGYQVRGDSGAIRLMRL
jgi:parallel beta-helix repeat protein